MVTFTGGRLPPPSCATTSSGTTIPVAVLPANSRVAVNFTSADFEALPAISPCSPKPASVRHVDLGRNPQRRHAHDHLGRDTVAPPVLLGAVSAHVPSPDPRRPLDQVVAVC